MIRVTYFVLMCLFIIGNFAFVYSYPREFDYRMCHGEKDVLVSLGFNRDMVDINCERYANSMQNSLLGIRRF